MEKLNSVAKSIMEDRFSKDTVIALATVEEGLPAVRYVNAYYEDKAFYIVTHRLSNKMRQIGQKPQAALAGDWFTAKGIGADLGPFCGEENAALAKKLESIFAAWIHNGHTDLLSEDTCILRIKLTSGVLFSHGTRYDIDFTD